MENESRPQKRPFSDTQEFVNKAYVEAYLGERRVDEAELDRDKPFTYTKIDDEEQFFQVDFNNQVMKTGDEIPLIMMPVDEKPSVHTPAYKRRPNATLLYLFSDGEDPNDQYVTLQDIANLYGLTRERVRQDVKRGIKDLYKASTNKMKDEYEFATLNLNKPTTLVSRMNIAEAHGSETLEIARLVERGIATDELIRRFGGKNIAVAREVLSRWGLKAPERVRRNISDVADKIANHETTREELSQLIKEFDNIHAYVRYSQGDQAVLVSITSLTSEACWPGNSRLIKKAYSLLEQAGVPVHMVRKKVKIKDKEVEEHHHFSLVRTKEEAIEILKKANI